MQLVHKIDLGSHGYLMQLNFFQSLFPNTTTGNQTELKIRCSIKNIQ